MSLCVTLLQVFDLLGDTAVPGSGVVGLSSSSDGFWTERGNATLLHYVHEFGKTHTRSNWIFFFLLLEFLYIVLFALVFLGVLKVLLNIFFFFCRQK